MATPNPRPPTLTPETINAFKSMFRTPSMMHAIQNGLFSGEVSMELIDAINASAGEVHPDQPLGTPEYEEMLDKMFERIQTEGMSLYDLEPEQIQFVRSALPKARDLDNRALDNALIEMGGSMNELKTALFAPKTADTPPPPSLEPVLDPALEIVSAPSPERDAMGPD